MTLRHTIEAAPNKIKELINKVAATSSQAVKTRERLFEALSVELRRYNEVETKELLPLLHKNPETKALAADASKGNKDFCAQLAKLEASQKDDDAFLVQLSDVGANFQKHIRDKRNRLLRSVLKALSDVEAGELALNAQQMDPAGDETKRQENIHEAIEAKRQAAQAASAHRVEVRAQKTAERNAGKAAEKVAKMSEIEAAPAQSEADPLAAAAHDHAQQAALQARDVLASTEEPIEAIVDLSANRDVSAVSTPALFNIHSAWEWFGNATLANAKAAQQLLGCRSVREVAEVNRELFASAMRNWMEGSSRVFQITQATSERT